jgi:uncharacterized protein
VVFSEGTSNTVILSRRRRISKERITSERFALASGLRKRFQDKPKISFTDLTCMVIMRERSIQKVLTDDDHFIQVGMGLQKIS